MEREVMENSVQPEMYKQTSDGCYKLYLEGPDGSGKTVLAGQLANKLNCPVIKLHKHTTNVINVIREFTYLMRFYSKFELPFIIFDRSYFTDLIYRSIDKQTPEDLDLGKISDDLSNTIIIYCTNKNYITNSQDRAEGEMKATVKKLNAISKRYDAFFSVLECINGVKIVRYDYENQSIDGLLKLINDLR